MGQETHIKHPIGPDLYETVPATAAGDAVSIATYFGNAWAWYAPGVPAVIKGIPANGQIPAHNGVPSFLVAQPASVGDWIVPVDANHDGTCDDLVLVRHGAFPRLVTAWVLDNYYGTPTAADVSIHSHTVKHQAGHKYLFMVNGAALMDTTAGHEIKHYLKIGTSIVCSQNLKMHRGGYAGLSTMPVALSWLWTAPSAGDVVYDWRISHTSYADWILDQAKHSFIIYDMGPG